MKQVNALTTLCFLAVFALVVASCSKEGPTGATGPAGPAGPAGAAGAAGPKGDTGVANITYSAWLDAKYIPETTTTGGVLDTIGFYYDAAVPKLTAAILNTGDVKVYINLGTAASPVIVPLPYFDPYFGISINPTFSAALIDLYSNLDVSTYTDQASGQKRQQWRYILIPGGKPARSAVDWNNYAEVKKYLNLAD